MTTASSAIRLAGEELRHHRHLCALVESPAETDALLLPFIVDGLERGERVVSVVDPQARDASLRRMRASGIDIAAAMASHQLEVLTWADAYLRGGRFDRSAQLAYLRQTVAETRELGYPLTRYIGSTEWAVEAQTVQDLLAYEARVDAAVRRLPDVFVCTYDLTHHSARTIADALDIHSAAIVGGVLRASREVKPLSPRERLVAAASELFHESGIQATGVDAIISAAYVAKATFYRHFPSKDHLVVAWLEDTRTNWLVDVRHVAEDRASSAAEVIPLLFDAAAEWFEGDGYRGCPYLNASVELTDQAHPALPVVRAFLEYVAQQLGEVAAAARLPEPEAAGRELKVLMSGAIGQALAYHSVAPFQTARQAAIRLADTASPA
jgi:AcrR family transcriptional regulator